MTTSLSHSAATCGGPNTKWKCTSSLPDDHDPRQPARGRTTLSAVLDVVEAMSQATERKRLISSTGTLCIRVMPGNLGEDREKSMGAGRLSSGETRG